MKNGGLKKKEKNSIPSKTALSLENKSEKENYFYKIDVWIRFSSTFIEKNN